jgi:UDP-galactose transporter
MPVMMSLARRVGVHSSSSANLQSIDHSHGSGSGQLLREEDEDEGNFSNSSTEKSPILLSSSQSTGGSAFSLKWMALLVLVLQNSSLILFMRASRVSGAPESVYLISTAVAVAEAVKLVLASLLMFYIDCNASVSTFFSTLRFELCINWREFMKMCVPSGLYVVQNNLQYLGASHLPAAVFQVLVQMKIITTALFSVTMLSRKLSGMQWIAIVSLGLGIGVVQVSQNSGSSSAAKEEEESGEVSGFIASSSMVGVVAVLVSCLTSGFAGVYFEKVLKTNSTSIWMRNIQLAIIGIVIALVSEHCMGNSIVVFGQGNSCF